MKLARIVLLKRIEWKRKENKGESIDVLFPVPRQHVCLLIIFDLYLYDMNIAFSLAFAKWKI
jgi:hypothetical protein